jgi:hypothetical protein
MGRTYEGIDQHLATWLLARPVFFVATAPIDVTGHVNCSPKGGPGSFVVLGERQVAYQDLTGSGAETVAHLRENGRIVLMFCAFDGPPKIVRLHGRGVAVMAGAPRWEELSARFPDRLAARAVVLVDVERISTSCGYGVPLMRFEGHRHEMERWAQSKGADGLDAYRRKNNAESIDGLPALPVPYPADV